MYKSYGREPKKQNTPKRNRKSGIRGADILAVSLALLCAFSLIITSASESEKYISAAITFDPPEEPKEKSFWDIFAEGAARFFASFAPENSFEGTGRVFEGTMA